MDYIIPPKHFHKLSTMFYTESLAITENKVLKYFIFPLPDVDKTGSGS